MSKKNAKQYYIAINEYNENQCSPIFTENSMDDVLNDFFEEAGLDINEIYILEIGQKMKACLHRTYSLEKIE